MRGETVKRKLRDKGFVLSDIAAAIGKTPQNLDGQLKSEDVKSGLLENIAKVVGYGMDLFYDELTSTPQEEIPVLFENGYLKQITNQQKETIETQRKLVASLERRIEDLEFQLDLRRIEILNMKKDVVPKDDSADYADAK